MSSPDSERTTPAVPSTLRWAGWIITLQGVIGVVVAVVYVIREASGHHEDAISGYGSAVWFAVIGGGVLAGGIALIRGHRWGRGIGMMAQILLLPVAYALLTASHLPLLGAPVGIVALACLGLLFAPASLSWLNADSLPPDAR
ncbi:hypothetical protein L5G28_07125 [Gordonia sp. HY285]|uniref:hypothetical protein n=1 Tax=Gordonia liuliyuniae TaxID=2911517 RepID=UPI001F42F3E6|nr:hypothetical protein [Gordonia liuliyuniae]MCF8609935.1 hypothetical protein [Gordonia liuliyuniae]